MSQKNTLTIGGAGAGGVTALQVANDLASLTMFGISCIDGSCGFEVDLAVVEAGTRVCAVVWGVAVTLAAAAIGRAIAHYIEPAGAQRPSAPPPPANPAARMADPPLPTSTATV